jgi:hypothetical protein
MQYTFSSVQGNLLYILIKHTYLRQCYYKIIFNVFSVSLTYNFVEQSTVRGSGIFLSRLNVSDDGPL